MDNLKNEWGGNWTADKVAIFIKYVKAYLEIMKDRPYFELVYFDGFAGSGEVTTKDEADVESIALSVLAIDNPRPFDMYYLVELDSEKATQLKQKVRNRFPDRVSVYIAEANCNEKIVGLANYMRQSKNRRGLVVLDPYGMALDWAAVESLKDVKCDVWMLVPTGIGVNRLLTKSGKIDESWMLKLTAFLGIPDLEVKQTFYREETLYNLFGEERNTVKIDKANEKIIELYRNKLKTIFQHVSKPHEMRNSRGSLMFHFLLASQNKTAVKIADDIIKKGS